MYKYKLRILSSFPQDDGYSMPAEFSEHSGCIMIFPERRDSWQYGGYAAKKAFCKVAEAISKSENVTMLASAEQYDTARRMLPENIRICEMSTDDSWARDVTPVFVKNSNNSNNSNRDLRGVDFGFNAWGGLYDGLYFPWQKDNSAARKICDLYNINCYNARDFILEGGSVHSDGEGTVITTEECLLSKGRNFKLNKFEIEGKLKKYLNAKKILWLPYGIYNDETNGHVDNICAFVNPGEVVLAWTDNKDDPQYKRSIEDLNYLQSVTDAKGRKLIIHKLILPSPVKITAEECEGLDYFGDEPTRQPNERLAASYVNFYIANKNIIMPAFGDKNDIIAKQELQKLFPEREVIQIYSRDILIGGGNIHCITCQIPKY